MSANNRGSTGAVDAFYGKDIPQTLYQMINFFRAVCPLYSQFFYIGITLCKFIKTVYRLRTRTGSSGRFDDAISQSNKRINFQRRA